MSNKYTIKHTILLLASFLSFVPLVEGKCPLPWTFKKQKQTMMPSFNDNESNVSNRDKSVSNVHRSVSKPDDSVWNTVITRTNANSQQNKQSIDNPKNDQLPNKSENHTDLQKVKQFLLKDFFGW